MKKTLLYITVVTLISCVSCTSGSAPQGEGGMKQHIKVVKKKEDKIISNIDISEVDEKHSEEFVESLIEIEKKYGEQWDFCTCVIKNDSINKAFSSPVSDKEFDRLSERFDVIDEKCKAFLVQNPNQTPEERANHEKKVKKCLKEAGIK